MVGCERSNALLSGSVAAHQTPMAWIDELLGRTLVLVAHPDDECIAFGALLQRMREPVVVFATNGSPQDPYFWQQYGSREAYAGLRREEAFASMHAAGVKDVIFLSDMPGGEQAGRSGTVPAICGRRTTCCPNWCSVAWCRRC